jgi:hypothetical protein
MWRSTWKHFFPNFWHFKIYFLDKGNICTWDRWLQRENQHMQSCIERKYTCGAAGHRWHPILQTAIGILHIDKLHELADRSCIQFCIHKEMKSISSCKTIQTRAWELGYQQLLDRWSWGRSARRRSPNHAYTPGQVKSSDNLTTPYSIASNPLATKVLVLLPAWHDQAILSSLLVKVQSHKSCVYPHAAYSNGLVFIEKSLSFRNSLNSWWRETLVEIGALAPVANCFLHRFCNRCNASGTKALTL